MKFSSWDRTSNLVITSTLGGVGVGVYVGFKLWSQLRKKNEVKCSNDVQVIAPPNADWTADTKLVSPLPGSTMVDIDPSQLSSCYNLIISAIVPRPIALVSTVSLNGVRNVAPFSYHGIVAHDPPTLMVSICRDQGKTKDTHNNITDTKELVVNVISDWYVQAANFTCIKCPPEEDEIMLANLTPQSSIRVKPPCIGEAAVQMECKLVHSHDIINIRGEVTTTMFVAEVIMFHVHESLLDKSKPDRPQVRIDGYRPISRLGGNTYGRTTQIFDISRPEWKKI